MFDRLVSFASLLRTVICTVISTAMSTAMSTVVCFILVLFSSLPISPSLAAEGQSASSQPALLLLPQIEIVSPTYDFGTVSQGTKVEHAFEIKNSGQAPLSINNLHPGCGCTVADPEKSLLAPGESTLIRATFDTANFQGYKVKTIRVNTNDPKNPSAIIGLQGTVKLDIDLDPSRVFFGRVKKGKAQSREVLVSVGKESTAQILDVSSRSELLDVKSEDLPAPSKGKKLTISLKESVPAGIFRSRIVIKTSSPGNPVLSIPIFANVEGDLVLEPAEASFGLLEGPLKASITQRLKLVNSSALPIKILSSESNDKSFTSSYKASEDGKSYEISVTLLEGALGPIKGEVKLVTDHLDPSQKELQIPVYGIVARKGG